jgi:hypothetical protein
LAGISGGIATTLCHFNLPAMQCNVPHARHNFVRDVIPAGSGFVRAYFPATSIAGSSEPPRIVEGRHCIECELQEPQSRGNCCGGGRFRDIESRNRHRVHGPRTAVCSSRGLSGRRCTERHRCGDILSLLDLRRSLFQGVPAGTIRSRRSNGLNPGKLRQDGPAGRRHTTSPSASRRQIPTLSRLAGGRGRVRVALRRSVDASLEAA